MFPPDDDGDDAQNIDESQFKRAVGLTDHSQSQNPSTQDIHNLDWTQTQPSNEMSTDKMPSKSEMPVKQEKELEKNEAEEIEDTAAEEPAEEPEEELEENPVSDGENSNSNEENDSLEKQPAMSDDDINLERAEENDDPIIIKKKKKPIKKKSGLKMTQFEDIKGSRIYLEFPLTLLFLEAEFDAEADLANVSGDEDETGADEYEHEEITEVLPSQRKMEKEVNL